MRPRAGAFVVGKVYLPDMQEKKIGKNTSLDALRKKGFVSEDDKRAEADASTPIPPEPAVKAVPPTKAP